MAPDGNLFILDQATRTIYQTTTDGTLVAGTPLPSKLKRPEALAYDSENDVFYVAGGWSADLFQVSRSGEILEPIPALRDPTLPGGERTRVVWGTRVEVRFDPGGFASYQ